jgi:uncharacterized protein YggE
VGVFLLKIPEDEMAAFNRMTLLVLAALAGMALAGTATAKDTKGEIVVTGIGEVTLPPDIATLSIGVVTGAETATEALAQNSAAVEALLAQLAAAGVAPEDIQTSGLSVNPVWVYGDQTTPSRITGYSATNGVAVRVSDLAGLGALLDKAVSAGANTLNGLSFGLSDSSAALDQARRAAVADALRRADLYAQAAGVQLGSLLEITEGGGYSPQPAFAAMAEEKAVPIAAGQVSVTASVTVTYAIAK